MTRNEQRSVAGISAQRRGIVLSDLHLFARRSRATECWRLVQDQLGSCELVIFNGDTFDFRWSTVGDLPQTQRAALGWLGRALEDHANCEFHFVLGNHDCLHALTAELDVLARQTPRFFWHQLSVRLGNCLFLHGDCSTRRMTGTEFLRYRAGWQNDGQRGNLSTVAYQCADGMGLTRLAHACFFPRKKTVTRVAYYLDHAYPAWRSTIQDCYFGHTHLPFSGYEFAGVRFHNTGSAIRGMGFNPMPVLLSGGPGHESHREAA